jgi:hypothetical protein
MYGAFRKYQCVLTTTKTFYNLTPDELPILQDTIHKKALFSGSTLDMQKSGLEGEVILLTVTAMDVNALNEAVEIVEHYLSGVGA